MACGYATSDYAPLKQLSMGRELENFKMGINKYNRMKRLMELEEITAKRDGE